MKNNSSCSLDIIACMVVSSKLLAKSTLVIGSFIFCVRYSCMSFLIFMSEKLSICVKSCRRYVDIFWIQEIVSREQNSEYITSLKNIFRLSIDPDLLGSMARVQRFVDTASTHPRLSLEDDIVPLDTGFLSIFFCCPSANPL